MNLNLIKKSVPSFVKNKYFIIAVVFVLAILFYLFTRGGTATGIESAPASIGNVVEKVSVTGKVLPIGKADLAFERGGILRILNFKVGDFVKRGDLIASLDNGDDQASLLAAQANLNELQRGLRPEELALDQSTVDAASTTLSNANDSAINASRDGYTKAQNAVFNYSDSFFDNPQSSNPRINISTDSYTQSNSINLERLLAAEAFRNWKNDIDSAEKIGASNLLSNSENYLGTIKNFIGDLSGIVNKLSSNSSALSQSQIDSYVSVMNTAMSNLNAAISSVTVADTALKNAAAGYGQANNQFLLQKAGSSQESIDAMRAKVLGAQATLAKDSIISPIDGTITKADPNLGEFVGAGQNVFGVISNGQYKVEAYVPEADIAKIALNDSADITLDAYGSDTIFKATVTSIDPAETILEGVPTYKVTLQFDQKDDRIRSGMTANTDILTHEKDGVLTVPSRAIIDDSGKKSVRVLNKDGKTFASVSVEVGLKGSEGTTEIISGVTEGQKVVTYVK